MNKEIWLLLLVGHVLGDFYFQTENMAKKKENNIKYVIIHGLWYFAAMIVCTCMWMSVEMFVCVTVAAMIHCLIDIIKFIYLRKKGGQTKTMERRIFLLDQLLHMITLCAIGCYCVMSKVPIEMNLVCQVFFNTMGIHIMHVFSWLVAILLIHKPANIIIQKIIIVYKPDSIASETRANNAGRMIGTLERLIMLILISLNQYAAIGLVLTAKSIARYNRISEDSEFSEYYLLGTLCSVMLAIICSFLVI